MVKVYEDVKEALKGKEYDFLRTERHLAPNGLTKTTKDRIEIGNNIMQE